MTVAYPNVADRLFGRAHAIEPIALRAIIEGPIGQRVLAGERIEVHAGKKAAKMRRGRASAFGSDHSRIAIESGSIAAPDKSAVPSGQ